MAQVKKKKGARSLPRRRIKPNRLIVCFESGIGEITSAFNFSRKEDVIAAFNALSRSHSVSGMSIILGGKFHGARDGLGS